MSVSLSTQHKAFVKGQVASGRFHNESEVVREGLRLLAEKSRRQDLEERLLEGLHSGEPVEMDDALWARLRDRVTRRASLVDQPDGD